MARENTVPMPSRSANRRVQKPAKGLRKWFNVSGSIDTQFLVLLIIILIVGLATLYSASHVYAFNYTEDGDSFFYIRKQLIWACGGLAAMLIASTIDYHRWHKWAWIIWFGSLVFLVLALVLPSETGIKRWVSLGPLSFQPSEVAKFAIVVLFAHLISLNHKRMKSFVTGFIPLMLLLGVTCGLVVLEPHLSGTILIAALGVAMMWVGGVRSGYIVAAMGLAAVVVVVMVFVLGYEKDRMDVWFHPLESFANEITFDDGKSGRDHAWQTIQSLYAIGSGGLLGQGPGNSRQKHLFLPEPQNDFIFSIFCEEMGFVGAVIVLLLFALLVWRGIKIALKAPDKFGFMLAFGLSIQIGIQVFLNVGVVSNLLPNTGISLPFFSYGGTSIVMLMAQMGVVLSVSRQARMEKV